MQIKTGQRISVEMVKEKIDDLRVRYHEFEHMLRKPCFKWDLKTNKMTVKATKDVQEDLTEVSLYLCLVRDSMRMIKD